MLPPLDCCLFMFICGLNHIKIHPQPVGTGLAPVRKKYILNQINGQLQWLSLRDDIEFNLILFESIVVFVGFHGGSKPPPYAISNPCDNAHKTKAGFPL